MTSANKIWAVVPAGGRGARMGSELPKQYLQLAGKTILEHTLARLLGEPRIAGVVVAMAAGDDLGRRSLPHMRRGFALPPAARSAVIRC